MSNKFGTLGVDTKSTERMEIILPGEIDPLTDDSGIGKGENGADLPGNVAYIEFLPWDSEPGREFDRKRNVNNVRKGFRQKSRAELRAEAEKEDPIEDQAERLSVLATGWYLVGPDRKVIDVPFNAANAYELFIANETAWLRRQAWVFVANEANFMKSSSNNSSSSPSTTPAKAAG